MAQSKTAARASRIAAMTSDARGENRAQAFSAMRRNLAAAKAVLQRANVRARGIPESDRSVHTPLAALNRSVAEMDRMYGGVAPSSADDATLRAYARQSASDLAGVKGLLQQVIEAEPAARKQPGVRQGKSMKIASGTFGASMANKVVVPKTVINTHRAANGLFCGKSATKANGDPTQKRCAKKPVPVTIVRPAFTMTGCRTAKGTFTKQTADGRCKRRKSSK